jgi:hypothetical protein
MEKLTSEQIFHLENSRQRTRAICFSSLLGLIAVLNLTPMFVGLYQRPADTILSSLKETSLLLTGAAVGGAASMMTTSPARPQSNQETPTNPMPTETTTQAKKKEDDDDSSEVP